MTAGKSLGVGGSSVAGWVTVESGNIDPARCVVQISPFLDATLSPGEASRRSRTARETHVRKDGFFQLASLSPGNYQVEIRQPPLAPARVSPVRVGLGETFLPEPVLLHAAVNLALAIDPPLDWLGKPWQVRVSRAEVGGARFAAPVFDGAAHVDGQVRVPGQANGRFEVTVADSLGNRLYRDDDLRVDGPDDAKKSIEIELVTVQGTIALGKDPLPATLWFGGNARTGVAVKMDSDRNGRFHGVLPKKRFWPVGIQSTDPRVEVQTRVEVHANTSGVAKVEIDLPDTRVSGRVVDDDGRPAANARVSLLTPNAALLVAADEQGAFDARALPEGDIDLAAQAAPEAPDPDEASDPLRLPLVAGQPAGPVELRLRKLRTLAGKVVAPEGPLAGARLEIETLGPDGSRIGASHAVTDLSGAWSSRVPQKAARARVVVSPPDHALKAFEIPVDSPDGPDATLAVNEESGVLEIALPYSEDEVWEKGMGLSVLQNGVEIGSSLGAWARDHEGGVWGMKASVQRSPALAPGDYEVCIAPHALDPVRNPATCASGSLRSGGTLRLKPPRATSP